MKHGILVTLLAAALLAACTGNPEEKLESSLKAIQATLPKDLGNGVTYNVARYDKASKTIVFGYVVEYAKEPFTPEVVDLMKTTVQASLSDPSLASDPMWKAAYQCGAAFRYEYELPAGGGPAGSFTLYPGEYGRY